MTIQILHLLKPIQIRPVHHHVPILNWVLHQLFDQLFCLIHKIKMLQLHQYHLNQILVYVASAILERSWSLVYYLKNYEKKPKQKKINYWNNHVHNNLNVQQQKRVNWMLLVFSVLYIYHALTIIIYFFCYTNFAMRGPSVVIRDKKWLVDRIRDNFFPILL